MPAESAVELQAPHRSAGRIGRFAGVIAQVVCDHPAVIDVRGPCT